MADDDKDILVSTQWVHDHLEDGRIRLVEVDEDPASYEQAHLPSAVRLDWRTELQDPVRRDLADPGRLAALLGARGVGDEHTIVLYGDRSNWFAAYAYWCLTHHGHPDLRLMDGSRETWIAEGRPTSRETPVLSPRTFAFRAPDPSVRARRDDVLAALTTPTRLVDVRSPQEHRGERSAMPGREHHGALRSGRIPGAVSVPWSRTVREDGTFRSAEELRNLYAERDLLGDAPLITYCATGERAAHSWFVLHELLGRDDARSYDGSWSEWGNLVGAPIEKDD